METRTIKDYKKNVLELARIAESDHREWLRRIMRTFVMNSGTRLSSKLNTSQVAKVYTESLPWRDSEVINLSFIRTNPLAQGILSFMEIMAVY